MFNSTGNNFGAETIQFKDYQEEDYVVLNAKFSYDPANPLYQAADHLEVYVPDLSLSRSIDTPAYLSFKDSHVSQYGTWVNDGATIIRSWIKDKNTICFEKFTNFDNRNDLTIWVQMMYIKKGGTGTPTLYDKTTIRLVQDVSYMRMSNIVCVITDHWAALHAQVEQGSYKYEDDPWVGTLQNFPTDINTDILVIGGSNQYNRSVDGASFGTLNAGVFSLPTRMDGFGSTGYYPFFYGYFVREAE